MYGKENPDHRRVEKRSTAGRRIFAALLTGAVLTFGLAGCGDGNTASATKTSAESSAEDSSLVTTPEATTESSAASSTETAAEETTEQAAENSTMDAAIDDTPLTEGLSDMAEKYSQGAFAGISFQSAVTAAKMLDWYVTQKPAQAEVSDTVKTYISENGIDTDLLQNGLEIVYSAAEDTLTDTGALETGGWDQGVTWTEEDIQSLFGAICEGAGIAMP